jgi:hypothetical protein
VKGADMMAGVVPRLIVNSFKHAKLADRAWPLKAGPEHAARVDLDAFLDVTFWQQQALVGPREELHRIGKEIGSTRPPVIEPGNSWRRSMSFAGRPPRSPRYRRTDHWST